MNTAQEIFILFREFIGAQGVSPEILHWEIGFHQVPCLVLKEHDRRRTEAGIKIKDICDLQRPFRSIDSSGKYRSPSVRTWWDVISQIRCPADLEQQGRAVFKPDHSISVVLDIENLGGDELRKFLIGLSGNRSRLLSSHQVPGRIDGVNTHVDYRASTRFRPVCEPAIDARGRPS